MNVRIDEALCQGHALCSFSAPEVFRLRDEDGHAELTGAPWTAELEDKARRAALGCPEHAIVVED